MGWLLFQVSMSGLFFVVVVGAMGLRWSNTFACPMIRPRDEARQCSHATSMAWSGIRKYTPIHWLDFRW